MSKTRVNLYFVPHSAKQIERINIALKLLELEGVRASFERLATQAMQNHKTFYDFLESILDTEIAWKEDNGLQRWMQQARFPWKKTLSDFDFTFQPSINQAQIHELASSRFVEKAENIVFIGQPGVGKTHLAIALGLEAIQKGYDARFLTLEQLIDQVDKTMEGEEERRLFALLQRPKLLILDEIDLYETSDKVSKFLFRLLRLRYEKGSVIFTSNRNFTEWGKLFKDQTHAGQIVDRIVHHGTIIPIEGESYRIKHKLKSSAVVPFMTL